MELEQKWAKLRDLLESIDKLKAERHGLNESIKAVEANIDRIIADGGETQAWDKLQDRWNRLGILRSHRRANSKEIAELKTRAGSIIEDGKDPADDGQTGLFTGSDVPEVLTDIVLKNTGAPPTPAVPAKKKRKR